VITIVYPQFYGIGGIARYLDSFLQNLPPDHPPIALVTGDLQRSDRAYPGVEIVHIPLSTARASLARWSLRARHIVHERFQAGSTKWVNFHWPPLIPGLVLPAEVPLVLTAHTTYLGMSGRFEQPPLFRSQWSDVSLRGRFWIERRVLARASKVIVLTEQARQEVLHYGFSGEIVVIPNGADMRQFTPGSTAEKNIDVLFCGRIERRKGSVPMVLLCRRLVAQNPRIRIAIVGYGEDEAWVREQLHTLAANITLAGKVPFSDVTAYYRRSKVYASTSYYEGLPGTCLEAMAMGLPAVVWDLLFYRGLVVDGVTGHRVTPNEVNSMAQRIAELLDEVPRAGRMGQAGRELLLNDYNWTKLAVDVLRVFR